MEIINLIMVAILIALTAFFVATEFAIVKIRTTRLDQLVTEGNTKAVAARKVVGNLDEYLSACQLGITITALGLGWLGEPTVEHLLHPLFVELDLSESVSSILSFIIAFALITFLHVVIGELAPKTLAIQKAEAVTLRIAKPIMFFYKIMYPFIKTLNGSARIFTGWFGLKPASEHELAHSEEELRLILSESYKSGEINQSEFKYVNNIFQFDDRTAKEIMVPRVDMITLDKSETVKESIAVVTEENYTRYPIVDGDKDSVVGMVNMKQVLTDFVNGKNPDASLEEYVRPVIQVFETMPIHDLLLKMQKERVHMAILIDEYGGTSGLVTVEDILEEIVGEIRDEFDEDEVPDIKKVDENRTILDGKVLISEVNDLFGLNINDEDVDTIGGWILSEKIEIKMDDEVSVENYRFKILEIDGYHVKSLEVLKVKNEESLT
ncbi:CBS domain containing-hemolysin-like protein [Fictibacillus halophilus]|uniref:CBS domain containing-hemolysin-like protein n=1 Tax=Fictibacillus halophilus TaxID=1610490 RepID=A0ABV2LMP4_9BACL|nr:hemolysin family protein [Fictibacillus halophilus]